jgi:hypothetical protein
MSTTQTPLQANNAAAAALPTFTFKTTKQVSKPMVKLNAGDQLFVKFLSAIHEGELLKTARKNADGTEQKPMNLASCFNYADKHQIKLIINQALGDELQRSYPNNGYVGKTFSITYTSMKTARGGNKYAAFDIAEGEIAGIDTPPVEEVVTPAPAKLTDGQQFEADLLIQEKAEAQADTPAPAADKQTLAGKPVAASAGKPAAAPAGKPAAKK